MSAWDEAKVTAYFAEIEAFLVSRYPGVRALTPYELVRYRTRSPLGGWRLASALHMPEVDVLILHDFPYTLPRVALVAYDRDMPHTEHDGVLCLEQDGTTFDHTRPIDVVEYELARAASLIQELQGGQHQGDFARDFERYWNHYAHTSDALVLSLLEKIPAVQHVQAARVGRMVVVADPPERAVQWIRNRFGADAAPERTAVVLCPLAQTPKPSEYPTDGASLFKYLDRACPQGALFARQIAKNWPREVLVVFCIDRTPKPAALGAIRLSVAMTRSQGKKRHRLAKDESGGVASQWAAAVKVERLSVRRAEAAWVHGRYTDAHRPQLSTKAVAVIGVGSLGARVAQLLAQSGIGKLSLIDADVFELVNSSRHALGADSLGHNKAEAVASMIRRSLPHHEGIVAYPQTWQQLFRDKPEVLTRANLILSLTGNWNADVALSDLQHSAVPMPSVIYGWVEPYACAAHAVLLKAAGPCLRCHFSDTGRPDRRVTEWPEDVETVPVCGAVHTPFGAAALGFAQAMLASMAIDALLSNSEAGEWRVWTSAEAEVTGHGGTVSPRWVDVFGRLGKEPRIQQLSWRQSELCRACRVAVPK
jgi:hypothetical protein